MQSLLEDPVFYNLLVNNNESLRSNSTTSSTSDSAKPDTAPSKIIKTNNLPLDSTKNHDWDFGFLKKLSFPELSIPQHPHHQLHHPLHTTAVNNLKQSSSSETATSYQSSIFSSNDNNQLVLDDSYVESIDDFFNKEMSLQINSEIQSQASGLTYPSQHSFQPEQPQIPAANSSQKQFHKFYSSNKIQASRITKPTITTPPSSNLPTSASPILAYHKCPFCQRQFKNKSYLARHLKKHDTVKDFKCPFFNEEHSKCHHLNGEFSRKDTYKAHLKSIHFIYPVGVFKCDRNLSIGRCAGCFKEFQNNNDWLNSHIENEECQGLSKFKQFE